MGMMRSWRWRCRSEREKASFQSAIYISFQNLGVVCLFIGVQILDYQIVVLRAIMGIGIEGSGWIFFCWWGGVGRNGSVGFILRRGERDREGEIV